MRLGFIGIGKIASAVIEAFINTELTITNINLSPRNAQKSKRMASKYSFIKRMINNQEVLDTSEIVFLALPTGTYSSVLKELTFKKDHTVVSFIPYSKSDELKKLVFPAGRIVRAIPLPTVKQHNCPIPIFNGTDKVNNLFSLIGQPLSVNSEASLHVLWALTGLISPIYDQMSELSDWAVHNKVEKEVANRYVADLYQSLSYTAQKSSPISFKELSDHAATPKGMNEKAGMAIKNSGSHTAYRKELNRILKHFG